MIICNITKLECSVCKATCTNRKEVPNKEPSEIYKKAIETYGHMAQVGQAQEELSELNIELNRYRNSRRFNMDRLADEVADVEIMLSQIKMIMGTTCNFEEMVQEHKDYKTARLERRLEETKEMKWID